MRVAYSGKMVGLWGQEPDASHEAGGRIGPAAAGISLSRTTASSLTFTTSPLRRMM